MQNWRTSWRAGRLSGIGILIMLLFCWPSRIKSDCGPYYNAFYGYTFINPKITQFDTDLAPFFLDFTEVYQEFFQSQQEIYQADNTREWYERFCGNAKMADIRFIVYKASRYELESLRAMMASEKGTLRSLGARLANNSFVRYLAKHNCREVVDYLIFAKRCEDHVTVPDNRWEERTQDTQEMRRLIDQAKDWFLRIESHYVKLRYAFQAIRLAHYLKDYDLTLELCDYYLPKIDNDPSLVEYWIMGHRAGALLRKGERAEAAYLYSRIFDQCPSKRESAFRSFRIESNEEWEACLLLCKNDNERAALHVLRANASSAHLVEEMNNIYAYDPGHHALEMLLVRELQRLEKDLLAKEINPKRSSNLKYHNIPRALAGEQVIELQALVRRFLAEGKVRQPALWKVAEGYLEVLAGDYYFAERTLAEASKMVEDKDLKEQLQVFRLVLKILQLDVISDRQERELASLPRRFKFYENYPDFPRLIRDKMRIMYRAQGDDAKAYLMEYSLTQLRLNPRMDVIDELLLICAKEDRNRFEKELVEKEDGTTIALELLDLKSAYLLSNGQLEAAQEVMKEIPLAEWDNLGIYNPFIRRFKDCVHCPIPDTVTTFNRGELIERMLKKEYDARAATDMDQSASLYFDLGEAYYNLTYFGPSWRAADAFRSGSSAQRAFRNKGQEVFDYPGLELGNREVFNCDRAKFYFDKARAIARSDEIAAAATYMAAKCERNDFYTQKPVRTYDNFALLRDNYQHTEFYQRVIRECLDFQAYVLK